MFLSVFIGMIIVIIVYLGTNIAYFAVLGVEGMLDSTIAVAQVQYIWFQEDWFVITLHVVRRLVKKFWVDFLTLFQLLLV